MRSARPIWTGRVLIGRAYVPPPRRIESTDEVTIQSLLLRKRRSIDGDALVLATSVAGLVAFAVLLVTGCLPS